jgi:hypothetical protein
MDPHGPYGPERAPADYAAFAEHAPGIRLLRDEWERLPLDAPLYIVGIEDPGRGWTARELELDSMDRVAASLPQDGPALLLVHRPQAFAQAARLGFPLVLAGHTHGGQLCLPGGHPVTLEARIPRRLGRGPWVQGGMQGYTSAGAGSSLVAARLNCPPEITVHVLQGPPGT